MPRFADIALIELTACLDRHMRSYAKSKTFWKRQNSDAPPPRASAAAGWKNMASLRDLAQSLGLSVTTVSRALDGYSDGAEATRERVRAAADLAAYRPNAAARRLRKGATEVVTLILPTEPGHFNEPFYVELLAPIGDRLARA